MSVIHKLAGLLVLLATTVSASSKASPPAFTRSTPDSTGVSSLENGCDPVQPTGCCDKANAACTKTCTNYVPQYRRDLTTCAQCARGTYLTTTYETQVNGKSAGSQGTGLSRNVDPSLCKKASDVSCPKGTFFPLDKFGLVDLRAGGGSATKLRFKDTPHSPCVKCGVSSMGINHYGPSSSVSSSLFYQDSAGVFGSTVKSEADHGCKICEVGKKADLASCLNGDGEEVSCSASNAVTGPTKCADDSDEFLLNIPGGSDPRKYVTEAACKAQPGWTVDTSSKVCYEFCGGQDKYMAKYKADGTDCSTDWSQDGCQQDQCKTVAWGTFSAAGTTASFTLTSGATQSISGGSPPQYDCPCKQKYNNQVVSGFSCTDSSSTCESILKDSTTANDAGVGKSADGMSADVTAYSADGNDVTLSRDQRAGLQTASGSTLISAATAHWCATTASPKPAHCTAYPGPLNCVAGQYLDAPTLPPHFHVLKYDHAASRFNFNIEGSPEPPACKSCPKGKYSAEGYTSCVSWCPPGSAFNSTGHCAMCPSGKFSVLVNSSTCTTCPEGKFSGTASKDVGQYYEKTLNVSGATGCDVCYHQNSVAASTASPSEWWSGYRVYQKSEGVANCTLCPDGKTPSWAEKVETFHRSGNGYKTKWRWSFTTRGHLYTGDYQGAVCQQCEPGKFSNLSTQVNGRDSVTSSSQPGDEMQTCMECPAMHIPNPTQSGCIPCPPGSAPGVGLMDIDAGKCINPAVGPALLAIEVVIGIVFVLCCVYGDKKCFSCCKSSNRANCSAKIVGALWILFGIICLGLGSSLPLNWVIALPLLPLVCLCCMGCVWTACLTCSREEETRRESNAKVMQQVVASGSA